MLGSQQTFESVLDDFYEMKISDDQQEAILDDDYSKFIDQIQKGLKENVLNIESMHIGVHALTGVQRLMRFLPNITALNLYDNLIRDSGLTPVLNILKLNTKIRYLNIGCNDLGNGCSLALSDIIRTTPLTSLQIGRRELIWQANKIGADGLFTIISTIIETNTLRSLGLAGIVEPKAKKGHNKITTSQLISDVIEKCSNLSTLDASYTYLSDEDQKMLEVSFSNNQNLRHLTLIGNTFSKGIGVANGISQIKTLKYLDISNCSLSQRSCEIFAQALADGWELINLNLSENPIGSDGIISLFQALIDNNTLTSLNLSHVGFDSSAVDSIYNFMQSGHVLDTLNLSRNFAGDELAYAFADTIGENQTIRKLNLSSCRITDDGAIAVANALVPNNCLRKLIIEDNFISTAGCYEMVAALQPNENITYLGVKSNQIDHFAFEAVATLCKRNKIAHHDKSLQPLRREYVRLSIETSKMSRVKDTLGVVRQITGQINEKIENLNYERENYEDKTHGELNEIHKSIDDYKTMIAEEQLGLEDAIVKKSELEKDHSEKMMSVQAEIDADTKKKGEAESKAIQVENGTKAMQEELTNQKDNLQKEIDVIKKLIEIAEETLKNKEKAVKWKIPQLPNDETLRKMALGEIPLTQQPTKSKKKLTKDNSASNSLKSARRLPKIRK
ncbi:Leucine Rich Repeat family protein [Trichomonas vaginalis G3]|uniref:Leucine Rich Repeat family protein n=1 Tax=Trichomonas vaginalis (strain ATCC PRA-98 / G3) TaxID=412133 RepID=A2DYC0_TRIV3|nr:uncharacterized protein TVAGG3_0281780 [Trichomonas vaginalis G3]EAY14597.1 Leucine Rich Repeat family protein [Trichomonas vaginalis G3]KAI5526608.1 interleukin-8 biosynthetic process [Trichomonas vaginalis G3]|eukprot:XP_001326820.1 hypothetical protein [Trichomonas vaginalis G3]